MICIAVIKQQLSLTGGKDYRTPETRKDVTIFRVLLLSSLQDIKNDGLKASFNLQTKEKECDNFFSEIRVSACLILSIRKINL